MQLLRERGFWALLVGLLFPTITSADHLPTSKLARGKDEIVLAGIEVGRTPIQVLVRRFGKPAEQRETFPAAHDVVGERLYKWKKQNITLEVETFFADKPIFVGGVREVSQAVVVNGTDGIIGKTGQGLKLGDPYSAIAAIYGTRYAKKGRQLTIEWETTTSLEVGWNEQGRVNHIALMGPE